MNSSFITRGSTGTTESKKGSVATERQLVVFALANEDYGVDIGTVREIIRMQMITKVPRTPEFVEGVINLRGKVIPIVDLRKKFGLATVVEGKEMRIVVVDIDDQDVGVVVDAVTQVLRIPADCVEPPSSIITTLESDYLLGIAKLPSRLIILLDLQKVLSIGEKHSLSKMRQVKVEELEVSSGGAG